MELIILQCLLCRGGFPLLSFLYTFTTYTKPSTGVTQEPMTQKEGNLGRVNDLWSSRMWILHKIILHDHIIKGHIDISNGNLKACIPRFLLHKIAGTCQSISKTYLANMLVQCQTSSHLESSGTWHRGIELHLTSLDGYYQSPSIKLLQFKWLLLICGIFSFLL